MTKRILLSSLAGATMHLTTVPTAVANIGISSFMSGVGGGVIAAMLGKLDRRLVATVLVVFLAGVYSTGCTSNDPFLSDWTIEVATYAVTAAPGDTFDVDVTARWDSFNSNTIDLSLVEPSPSGAPFDTTIAALSRGCADSPMLPPSIEAISSPSACTVQIAVGASAPPGEYRMAIRGDFVDDHAVDDSPAIRLTVTTASPQSGWQVVADVTVPLLDLDFPTASIGYAVGNDGLSSSVMKSLDGGETWASLSLPVSGNLNRVQFLSESTGFVAGRGNTILKTSDGGSSWTDVGANIDDSTSLDVYAMYFVDEQHGYVGGGGLSLPTLIFTADGGSTWAEIDGPWIDHPNNIIRSIHFPTVPNGIVSFDNVTAVAPVQYTTNGGQSWSDGTGLISNFTNLSSGYAVDGSSRVYGWTGGGMSWSSAGAVVGSTTPFLNGVTTQNGTPWVAGGRSIGGSRVAVVAYQSGGSWTLDLDGSGGGIGGEFIFSLNDVAMFSDTEGVAVGVNSIIRRYP